MEKDVRYLITFVKTLKAEGLVLAALMVVLTYEAGYNIWFILATFLLFDLSMIGYIHSKKIGALTYNLGHSSVIPTLMLIGGILGDNILLQVWSYAWLFHIGFDRAMGYGLKHKTSFKHTHLGKI